MSYEALQILLIVIGINVIPVGIAVIVRNIKEAYQGKRRQELSDKLANAKTFQEINNITKEFA